MNIGHGLVCPAPPGLGSTPHLFKGVLGLWQWQYEQLHNYILERKAQIELLLVTYFNSHDSALNQPDIKLKLNFLKILS